MPAWVLDLLLKIAGPVIAHAVIKKYELYVQSEEYRLAVDAAVQQAHRAKTDFEIQEASHALQKAINTVPSSSGGSF